MINVMVGCDYQYECVSMRTIDRVSGLTFTNVGKKEVSSPLTKVCSYEKKSVTPP
jgi:hypothetical protein